MCFEKRDKYELCAKSSSSVLANEQRMSLQRQSVHCASGLRRRLYDLYFCFEKTAVPSYAITSISKQQHHHMQSFRFQKNSSIIIIQSLLFQTTASSFCSLFCFATAASSSYAVTSVFKQHCIVAMHCCMLDFVFFGPP